MTLFFEYEVNTILEFCEAGQMMLQRRNVRLIWQGRRSATPAEIGKRGVTHERFPAPDCRIRDRTHTIGLSLSRDLSLRRKVGGDGVLHRIISRWQI